MYVRHVAFSKLAVGDELTWVGRARPGSPIILAPGDTACTARIQE